MRPVSRLRAGLADRTVRGASVTFALKVAEAGATFLLSVLLARLLGASGYGVYALAFAWANLLIVPSLVGHETLTVRHVASYVTADAWGLLRGYLRRAYQLVGGTATLLAAGAAGVAWATTPQVTIALLAFTAAMAFVPAMALLRVSQAAMRGLHHVASGYLPELAVLPLLGFAVIGLVLVLDGPLTPALAAAAQLVGALGALVVAAVLLRRWLPERARHAPAEFHSREWLASALPLLFIGAMQVVNRQADILLLGAFAGDAAAGTYAVATRSAGLIGFVLFAVNAALAPNVARLHAQGDLARLQAIATRSTRLVLLFSIPSTIFLIAFGGWFLLLFGPEFPVAAGPLAILSIGQFVSAFMGSVGLLLTMTGHEAHAARGFGLGAVTNLVLNLVLIPPLGALGAAIATTISLVVWNVVQAWYVYRLLGLHSTALGVVRLRPRD